MCNVHFPSTKLFYFTFDKRWYYFVIVCKLNRLIKRASRSVPPLKLPEITINTHHWRN